MMKIIVRQPMLVAGLGFVVVMLAASFIHMGFFDSYVAKTPYLYDNDNNMIGAPFAPFDYSILGTDFNGNHLIYYILKGAKYTILGAFSIGLVSFFIAFLIGVPLGFKFKGTAKIVENTISVLYFIPASLIAYNLLKPLLWQPFEGFPTSLAFRLTLEVLVISMLLIPPAAILIASETSVILKRDFVISSRVLGGKPYHLFRYHLFPHLKQSFINLFTRQTIQAILVMTHLGVFELFFGGTLVDYSLMGGRPVPVTYDWASLIGMYYYNLQTHAPWLVGIPLIFLVLFILSLLGIARGVKNIITPALLPAGLRDKAQTEKSTEPQMDPSNFMMVSGSNSHK
ncbi:ABC transporter permease subunit [Thalassobacillus devorans]|uniref:ABC transporter permease subunit n=1 Tax=Thalassobacillus devorans TaxID=279813 RepID=UPI0004902892|nr:ABC transporter permease subunit [Thalassobacillus devorans]